MRLFFAVVLFALSACASSGTQPAAPVAKVSTGGEKMTTPTQLRVGRDGTVTLSLRNDGTVPAKTIEFMTDREFSEAWIVKSAEPAWKTNRQDGDKRLVVFDGIAPGESQKYQLIVTGRKTGEHDFKLTVSVDDKYLTTFSGRAVVVP